MTNNSHASVPDKRCFVISVIGEDESEERRHADELFEYIIEPAAKSAGYKVVMRADRMNDSGIIMHHVLEAIGKWELVIADLTYPNPNVYYELAARHITRRPIVHLLKQGVRLPFDIAPTRVLKYGMSIGGGRRAESELIDWIAAAERSDGQRTNPIAAANLEDEMQAAQINEKEVLNLLFQSLDALRAEMAELRRQSLGGLGLTRPDFVADHSNRIAAALMGSTTDQRKSPLASLGELMGPHNALAAGGLPSVSASLKKRPPD